MTEKIYTLKGEDGTIAKFYPDYRVSVTLSPTSENKKILEDKSTWLKKVGEVLDSQGYGKE